MLQNIITLIEAGAAHRGISTSTMSRLCSGSGDMHLRLERGADITTRRAEKIIQWFSDHWENEHSWPWNIPRPVPSPDSPVARARAEAVSSELNADGEIANLTDWCRRNAYELDYARYVIKRYGAGGPKEGQLPRRGTNASFVLEQLLKTGDRRFAAHYRGDQIAREAGLA